MPKILIHSIAFSPDGVSTAYLYNDIALKFKDEGYDVVVLTTTPHYNIVEPELEKQPLKSNCWGLFFSSNFRGITVIHIPQKKFKSSLLRILGFIYWHLASFILGIFERNVDIILSPSPPLTIGFINIILGYLKSAKVIYNIQEIYPDLLIESKGLRSKIIISILKWLERFVYNHSAKVTTIDQIFYNKVFPRFKDKSKLHIIPNFVDTFIYRPLNEEEININREYFPKEDSLKIMYAGNIGHAQDWETLVNVAFHLKEENIDFFIIGEGVMKDYLEKSIIKHNLSNIHVIPYQPRESMPSLLAYSDLQFIFMSPLTEDHGFPSKIYTIMACAKPILVCSGENTPIINFLKDKNCAFLVNESNLKKKTGLIVDILRSINKEELNVMGNSGFKNINSNYSKDVVSGMYVTLANSLLL